MANTLSRERARVFRGKGMSLNEIVDRLAMPKSTIRYWCRDIALSRKQQRSLYQKQRLGGIMAAEKIRQNRILLTKQILEKAKQEIGKISYRDLWIAGTALYWAEGYRKGDGEFGFTNSDPRMAQLIIRWLRETCHVPKSNIHLRICINAVHKNRINNIQKFWSQTLNIPKDQFSKPTLIKVGNKKSYQNSTEYFGTIRIKVRKSTNLRRKIIGWIEGLADCISSKNRI